MASNFLQHDLGSDIYFILPSWLVLIRNANIQNLECIHRGLEVAFRNDRFRQFAF